MDRASAGKCLQLVARIDGVTNSILPRQEAFGSSYARSTRPQHRWIQARLGANSRWRLRRLLIEAVAQTASNEAATRAGNQRRTARMLVNLFARRSKPESTDGFVGSTVWGRVAAGLVRVRAGAFWGVQDWGAGLVRLVARGVRLRCAGRCGRLR